MQKSIIFLSFIAIASAFLLVGQQFGFSAFGGDGFTTYPDLELAERVWPRGSTYLFSSEEIITPYANIQITGEAKTPIEFLDTRQDHFRIRPITGRVWTEGALSLEINNMDIFIDGVAETIHYSWKNEAELTLQSGAVHIQSPEANTVHEAPFHAVFSTETGLTISR